MAYGMSYQEVWQHRRKMQKMAEKGDVKNAQLKKNLDISLDRQLKNAEGMGSVEALNRELFSDRSNQLWSGKYLRSHGIGEGVRGEMNGFEQVGPGQYRKVYN